MTDIAKQGSARRNSAPTISGPSERACDRMREWGFSDEFTRRGGGHGHRTAPGGFQVGIIEVEEG